MPKARSSYRSGRAARRKTPYKRRNFARTVARIAKKVVYRNREPKQVCTALTSTALTENWSAYGTGTPLNGVAQGDGTGQRDGNQIYSRGLYMKMQLSLAADRPQAVRLMLVEKKEDFVSASPYTDMPGTNVRPMIGCVTPEMKAKYRVLWDTVINPAPRLDDGTTLFRHVYVNKFFKLNKKLTFHGSGTGDLEDGRLILFAVTDNLSGGTDHIDLAYEAIHYFKEL